MARDEDNSAISLFSFQDIITSITGIMFLVVLLLLLFVITSRPRPPEPAPESAAQPLTEKLAELQHQLDQLTRRDDALQQRLAELRQLSPAAVEARLKELRQAVDDARRTNEAEDARQRRLATEAATLTLEHEELERRQQTVRNAESVAAENLKRLTAELERKEAEFNQRRRVMEYAVDRTMPQVPALAEVGRDGVKVLLLSDRKIHDFQVAGDGTAGVRRFLEWARTRKAAQEYFCVLVRPGGFRYAEDILDRLKTMGFERGLEILPNDEATIFVEGAKP